MPEKRKLSRRKAFAEDSPLQEMPETSGLEYLLETWLESGRYSVGPAGLMPLLWSELAAWQRLSGVLLAKQDLLAVRELSAVYCATYREAEAPGMPPPYNSRGGLSRDELNDKIKGVFRSLMRSNKGKK